MNAPVKHSPEPLQLDRFGSVIDARGNPVSFVGIGAGMGNPTWTANTARLMRVWNAHDELVAALRDLLNLSEARGYLPGQNIVPVQRALALLAKEAA